MRKGCRLSVAPRLVCFLLSTFDLGLSIVDADDPEAKDGVLVLAGTSSLGKRDVEACGNGFELFVIAMCCFAESVRTLVPCRMLLARIDELCTEEPLDCS